MINGARSSSIRTSLLGASFGFYPLKTKYLDYFVSAGAFSGVTSSSYESDMTSTGGKLSTGFEFHLLSFLSLYAEYQKFFTFGGDLKFNMGTLGAGVQLNF
jgi:hypothetical protein